MTAKSSAPLPQAFGFWTGWFVVVASMVGSGILTNSGPIVKSTGSYTALFLLWIAGGALALAGALTLGELSSGLRRAGGDYAFVREAFGPAWGFLYGWAMVLLGFAAPIAVVAYTTASFLYGTFGQFGLGFGLGPTVFPPVVGSVIIAILTTVHCFGHRSSARVQAVTTVFKIATLFLFALAGILIGNGDWSHWRDSLPLTATRPASLASGLILVMYAYTGWNGAVYLAAEMRDSARAVPRCLFAGTAAVAGFYLLFNLLYVFAFPAAHIAAMSDVELSRLAEIAVIRLLGEPTARLFSIVTGLGVFASLSAYVLAGPRIVYAMAHDGLCPKVAGRVNERTQVPVLATVGQGVFALLFLWSGTFEQILNFTSYGLACISLLVVAPIFVLRRRPSFQPVVRVPWYPWTPIAFLTVSVGLLIGGAWDDPRTAVLSLASIFAAFPIYVIWRKIRLVSPSPA